MLPFITALMPIAGKVLDRFIPDAEAKRQAEAELQAALIDNAAALSRGQLEINKIEAAHKSIFVAGWRPAIGWVCACALFWAFLGNPIANWVVLVFDLGAQVQFTLSEELWGLVFAMLGMGGLRTFEKLRGVARER